MVDESGTWNNGVALIVSGGEKISLDNIRKGDVVTFRTDRTNHRGHEGQFDHIGLVTKVKKDKDGKVLSFEYYDSGGTNANVNLQNNPNYRAGPRGPLTYKVDGKNSYGEAMGYYRLKYRPRKKA